MHLFVDNLTNVDFSYLDHHRGLIGETWLASIVLDGALDQQGMVCDFGIVKKTVREWLDNTIDHCLLVANKHPAASIQEGETESQVSWQLSHNREILCRSPIGAITYIDTTEITPKNVSLWCVEQLRALLPESLQAIELVFKPEPIDHHFYHYSHGLKKHDGNCQRIAHGHRSTIEIYQDNKRNHALEKAWCEQWQDIYIATDSDLVETFEQNGECYQRFAYTAEQGEFSLSLPATSCYHISTDSTVEWIAQHIAATLKQQFPESSFTVKAFEGIGKGAIAQS